MISGYKQVVNSSGGFIKRRISPFFVEFLSFSAKWKCHFRHISPSCGNERWIVSDPISGRRNGNYSVFWTIISLTRIVLFGKDWNSIN